MFQRKVYLLIKYVSPPFMLNLILRIASELRYRFYSFDKKKELRRNAQLKECKTHTHCAVLATGPSIKKIDVEHLYNVDCISVSNFFLHKNIKDIKPIIHIFTKYHPPLILENYIDWLRAANDRLPSNTSICIDYEMKYLVESESIFSGRKVYYFSTEKTLSFGGLKLSLPIISPETSPIAALQIAIGMGFDSVDLYGCDHTVLRDYGSRVKNFYSHTEELRQNATGGDRWRSGIESHLENLLSTFRQYRQINEVSLKQNIVIRNKSNDSWLEVFRD